jgi:hypothetical protein
MCEGQSVIVVAKDQSHDPQRILTHSSCYRYHNVNRYQDGIEGEKVKGMPGCLRKSKKAKVIMEIEYTYDHEYGEG